MRNVVEMCLYRVALGWKGMGWDAERVCQDTNLRGVTRVKI